MGADLDNASSIWKGVLTEPQLLALGLKEEKKGDTNKRPKKRGPSSTPSTGTSENHEALLHLVARMVIRHESTLQALIQEFEFLVYMDTGEGSVIPTMLATTRDWHQGTKDQTLRHTLSLTFIETLTSRLEKLCKAQVTDAVYTDCLKYNLVDADRNMPYLRWDPTAKKLTPSKEKSLPIGEVQNILGNVVTILRSEPQITLRFHALSNLQKVSENSRSIPFLWMVGHRTQGELWNLLHKISYHSIWQLVRSTLRPQNQQKTGLMKQIQETLQTTSRSSS